MGNLLLNIRFGRRHLQLTVWPYKLRLKLNDYWILHPMESWFKIYQIGNKHYR